jgi:hypothetical protein
LVLLVINVFGISSSLVWREMTLEEAQISDTHSFKGVVSDFWVFRGFVRLDKCRLDISETHIRKIYL